MPTLHGVSLSPFVRKVRIALAVKQIAYDQIPVVPFGQSEEFLAISPLGKIPVYEDEQITLPDSSVIIDYLEHVHPTPSLYPADPAQRAKALWLEEYGDTRLVDGLTTPFFQRFVRKNFFQEDSDEAVVKKALEETLPPCFDYLESALDGDTLIGGRFSIADIAVTSPFVNFKLADETVDSGRWPKLAAYIEANFSRPGCKEVIEGDLGGG